MSITPDDVRNPPCGTACPFVRTCLPCKFRGGEYGPEDEQPSKKTKKTNRKEDSCHG